MALRPQIRPELAVPTSQSGSPTTKVALIGQKRSKRAPNISRFALSADGLKFCCGLVPKGQILAVVEIIRHKVFCLFRKLLTKLAALSGTDCLLSERFKCLRTCPSVYHFARETYRQIDMQKNGWIERWMGRYGER